MPVIINWKICDNAKECNGLAACPTGAISWNEEEKTLKIDNSKCTSCGSCEPTCPVNAITVVATEEEMKQVQERIDKDPRTVEGLFVNRYGGAPVVKESILKKENLEQEISSGITAIEFFTDSTIDCLILSIPIKGLIGDMNFKKVEVAENDELLKKYEISKLPTLAFFKDGKFIGKIEGKYKPEQKEELKNKINEIISV